jgi:dipeptidyl aminopeptidase/acylaminoacyl peptidase
MQMSLVAAHCGRFVLAAAAALSLAFPAGAVESQPPSVDTYVKPPEFAQVAISRNGRYIAALAPLNGFRNIVVLDLETMKTRAITGLTEMDVVNFYWIGSQYLVFQTGKIDNPRGIDFNESGGLFSVRLDGQNFKKLAGNMQDAIKQGSSTWVRMEYLQPALGSEHEILVASNFRQAHEFDVYRIDLDIGKLEIQSFERPTNVQRWVLDREGVPRVAVRVRDREAVEGEQITTVMYREAANKPWRELLKYPGVERGPAAPWVPREVAPNGVDLIVEARMRDGVSTLHRLDVQSGKLAEQLVSSPRHDASETELQFSAKDGHLLAAVTRDETYSTTFFDKSLAELHAELSAAFPGKKLSLQRAEGGRTLVDVWSDRLPHTYYLFDEASAKLRLVLRSRVDLGEKDLVEMHPFVLKTRDGLEIPSYYFLPASYQPGQKLPTVVHIHGGPMVRADHWGPMETVGVREAQVLASRGYAVVMPNFRVTPGLGAKIYNAGFGEVGRKMSDDHEDAARWAVQQGFADADRICISGSSYGGYASLWASIRSADVFRCAVPGLLVSDMRSQLKTSDIRRSRSGVDYWKRLLGVKGDDWGAADEVSPLRFAGRSAMPLFIWAGGNDERTPLSETENMVDALKKAGKPVDTLLVKSGEAHGYGLQKNRVELYETMLKFLDRQIGSGWKGKAAVAGAGGTAESSAR